MKFFVGFFAALSAFNLSYRTNAKGEKTPEKDRNFWDAMSIIYWKIKPKDEKKGLRKSSYRVKAVAKKVQELENQIKDA